MGFSDWIIQILGNDEEAEIEVIRKGKPSNKYSTEYFRYLLKTLKLVQINSVQGRSFCLEVLREIVELLIWGEQNGLKVDPLTSSTNSSFFDMFLDENTAQYFLLLFQNLLKTSTNVLLSKQQLTELLQILIILFENVRTETSYFFLLSNNYINRILLLGSPKVSRGLCCISPLDDEGVAFYVTLLKTLSIKLTKTTLPFFFNEHLGHKSRIFPLYTSSLKLAFHPTEPMVRIASRTVTLNIFRLAAQEKALKEYLLNEEKSETIPFLKNFIKILIGLSLNMESIYLYCLSCFSKGAPLSLNHFDSAFNQANEECKDLILYLKDLLDTEWFELNEVLETLLLEEWLRIYSESIYFQTDHIIAGLSRFSTKSSRFPYHEIWSFGTILQILDDIPTDARKILLDPIISLWCIFQALVLLKNPKFIRKALHYLLITKDAFDDSIQQVLRHETTDSYCTTFKFLSLSFYLAVLQKPRELIPSLWYSKNFRDQVSDEENSADKSARRRSWAFIESSSLSFDPHKQLTLLTEQNSLTASAFLYMQAYIIISGDMKLLNSEASRTDVNTGFSSVSKFLELISDGHNFDSSGISFLPPNLDAFFLLYKTQTILLSKQELLRCLSSIDGEPNNKVLF